MSRAQLSLRELWTRMGFTSEELAARVGATDAVLSAASADPAAMDSELAGRIEASLGLSLDALIDGVARPSPLSALLKGNAQALSADARFTIAEAVSVAREVQGLRALLGAPTGLGRVEEFTANADYAHPSGGQASRLAERVRARLQVPKGRVDLGAHLLEPLGVLMLWAPLPAAIDALAIAQADTGAVIVANPHGAHMQTAPGRRMAVAHELCHLLFDRPKMERFGKACVMEPADGEPGMWSGPRGAEVDLFDRIERRARAFAPALLAPPSTLHEVWSSGGAGSDSERLHRVCAHFGLSASAASMHLANAKVIAHSEALRLASQLSPKLADGADELGPPSAPLGVPLLRAGLLLSLAERAFGAGLVSRRWAEEVVQGPWVTHRPWTPSGEAPHMRHQVSSQSHR